MSKIILQRLIIEGINYKRTIAFEDGLNIISGEKTSGKSLVLSLIDYCLGKSGKIDFRVQPELEYRCDYVFLEMIIGEEVFTFKRMLKKAQTKISIYFSEYDKIDEYTPKTLTISETMKLLMDKLNISEYKLIRHQKHSNKKEIEMVSFRDIFRYVYIHQHELGTNDFLGNKNTFKAIKNPHVFRMMFNLIDLDKDTLKEQLVETQNQIGETRQELVGLNSYLKDLDASNRIDLLDKSEEITRNIDQYQNEKIDTLKKNKTKTSNNLENKMYIKLKNNSKDMTDQILNNERDKQHLQLSVSSKEILLSEYQKELEEINETIEVNYKLIIPDQSVECPLCNSKISNHSHNNVLTSELKADETLKKLKKQVINKIDLVKGLIKKEQQQILTLEKETNILNKKQIILSDALKEYSKKTDVPFLSQIDGINIMINRLTKEHEKLKEGLRIHHKIDEKNNTIEGLLSNEKRLIKKIDDLKISDEDQQKIFTYLDNEYKAFMKRLKYDVSNDTDIHRHHLIPYYNGASVYSHESGGLLECMQLSYIGAILKSKTKGFAIGHPGFILLDSLSKYVGTLKNEKSKEKINDPEVYEEFFKILLELSASNQIILVENTPPIEYENYIKYTFFEGDKGLINEEMNEKK